MSEGELVAYDRGRRPPMPAIVLGAMGLLPMLIALFVRLAAGVDPDSALPGKIGGLALTYAAMILSFLGGIWWGVASTRATEEQRPRLLVIAVAPAILATILYGLSADMPVICSTLLGLVIALTPLVDRMLDRRRLVPPWWMNLRLPLSLALGALTIGLGFALT
ncbi:DUF3429 domain-containing protein [Sphingomonas sp. CGMCC 1.13654]|uniref:DUF3429 domain-containing protein n=1 Tax=Sphingomonas chungangi TaxID=2683589 RepID=A0A838L7F8_9SPHN|nr:DUF3429 domain-containing protein [Sphingomonas chungangi]MBA2935094.1 DUF3429 domain-containing protein [Sphingomonas chungangi]MVW54210.1 DUF3429 family protein [Sphingomonas chungangi]